jgi:hypothetical protein
MNNYTEQTGTYGMVQVMALDYVFRLWAEAFGHRGRRAAQGDRKPVAAPQTVICQTAAVPKACGC